MNNKKSMVISVLVIVLTIFLSSCNMVQVNEEKDRKTVVAEVNGQKIQKGEVLDQYLAYYGETEEYDKEVMADMLDNLIEEKLVQQKAESAGHVINEDLKNQAKLDYEQAIEDYAGILKERAGEDAEADADYMQMARDEMEGYFATTGIVESEYLEVMARYIAIQNYLDELTAGLSVDDSEIEKYYQDELEFQRENPSMAAYYSSIPIVTEPSSRRVKHILIKLSDEDTNAISELRQNNKGEEADALRAEKLEAIRIKAESVLAEAKADEDFEALIIKHGEDPGMELDEYKDGYTMLRDESMMIEFLEKSFQLEEGEISDLVATDAGYHIIKVYEANEDTIASLEEIKDTIHTALLNRKKSEKTDEFIAEWLEDASIKKYENRL